MAEVKTYNPKEITIALGRHLVSGLAEDSFVTIAQNSDGVTKKVGCYGEVVRSISPDNTYNIQLQLLWGSATNSYLNKMAAKDRQDGKGLFAILIKDLRGGTVFSSSAAWAVKNADRQFGREAGNVQWTIQTAEGTLTE